MDADHSPPQEDPIDTSLAQRHSPLLLFLHVLAAKPSFVYLQLDYGLTPFVFDHMPVWPHLLCLCLECDEDLFDYSFAHFAQLFPSLLSFTSPNCSEQAVEDLVAMPKLEELCFDGYSAVPVDHERVQKAVGGFRALSRATSLRSVVYWHHIVGYEKRFDDVAPAIYAALAPVYTLTHLTRLTVPAFWLDAEMRELLLSQHHFPHLRCFELHLGNDGYNCPQTDATLLPFVKPANVVVSGRAERQAARGWRPATETAHRRGLGVEVAMPIPSNNAAHFPALECLALPYLDSYAGEGTGRVSAWMKQQLRRSYEYERVEDWEAETTTLGAAQVLKNARVVRAL